MSKCIYNKVESLIPHADNINNIVEEIAKKYPDLYIIHVFYIGALSEELISRRAMFDSYPEADLWFSNMVREYDKYNIPTYIIMNGRGEVNNGISEIKSI